MAKLILAARRLGAACPVMAMEQHGRNQFGVIGWPALSCEPPKKNWLVGLYRGLHSTQLYRDYNQPL